MGRLILITFAFLGFAFWQLSGGAEFDPEETRLSRIDAPEQVEQSALRAVVVAEAAPAEPIALELASVQEVLAPTRTIQTRAARIREAQQEAKIETASLNIELEEEPRIILPSLIENAVPSDATVTPVEFGGTQNTAATSGFERRVVSGNRVNVRGGPGTDFQVVNRLVRGDEVEILEDPGNGWVRLRPVGGGQVGWMADFLLTGG